MSRERTDQTMRRLGHTLNATDGNCKTCGVTWEQIEDSPSLRKVTCRQYRENSDKAFREAMWRNRP